MKYRKEKAAEDLLLTMRDEVFSLLFRELPAEELSPANIKAILYECIADVDRLLFFQEGYPVSAQSAEQAPAPKE